MFLVFIVGLVCFNPLIARPVPRIANLNNSFKASDLCVRIGIADYLPRIALGIILFRIRDHFTAFGPVQNKAAVLA